MIAARGGGYAPGTPRDGWDHAELWLPHGVSLTGLEPRFITAELTLAEVNPAMSELIPLAHESRAEAERAIDEPWAASDEGRLMPTTPAERTDMGFRRLWFA